MKLCNKFFNEKNLKNNIQVHTYERTLNEINVKKGFKALEF